MNGSSAAGGTSKALISVTVLVVVDLDQTGGDEADSELLVVTPEERKRQNGGADVGDDQQQLQGRPDEDAGVAAAGAEDEVGVFEQRVVHQNRRDARDEGHDPQHAGDGRELARWHLRRSRGRLRRGQLLSGRVRTASGATGGKVNAGER